MAPSIENVVGTDNFIRFGVKALRLGSPLKTPCLFLSQDEEMLKQVTALLAEENKSDSESSALNLVPESVLNTPEPKVRIIPWYTL